MAQSLWVDKTIYNNLSQKAEQTGSLQARFYSLLCLLLLFLVGLRGDVVAQEDHFYYLPIIANQYERTNLPIQGVDLIYGVNFINEAEHPASAQRNQNGLSIGAEWDRWPIYWNNVETAQNQFDWSTQDAALRQDVAHGLQLNAILLGTPWFYRSGGGQLQVQRPLTYRNFSLSVANTAAPVGLYDPIFTDGTDIGGVGKQINPTNVWARFVAEAVTRYRPNGLLAQAEGWTNGQGITHWEVWNEPDLPWFWDGTSAEYARLLKVAYITIKQTDPNAQVIFGALANNFERLGYYDEVLSVYANDPLGNEYGFYHDILATHSYFYAWQSWYHVWRAGRIMEEYGFDKPIWLNESGVPAWDDYPGPIWDSQSSLRATMDEQASFVIQSAFYATFAGADAIFHFQLYDGCGNQPQNTDFPPHNGELCTADGMLINNPDFPCAGDANGLFRNPADAACFRQHPNPESPRPVATAFQVLTTYFVDVAPLWRERPSGAAGPEAQEWIAFYQPSTGKRIVGMWARYGMGETAVLPATSTSALLVFPDGTTQTITPDVKGNYRIQLQGASNQNAFWDPTLYPIGGRPVILIEDMP